MFLRSLVKLNNFSSEFCSQTQVQTNKKSSWPQTDSISAPIFRILPSNSGEHQKKRSSPHSGSISVRNFEFLAPKRL